MISRRIQNPSAKLARIEREQTKYEESPYIFCAILFTANLTREMKLHLHCKWSVIVQAFENSVMCYLSDQLSTYPQLLATSSKLSWHECIWSLEVLSTSCKNHKCQWLNISFILIWLHISLAGQPAKWRRNQQGPAGLC